MRSLLSILILATLFIPSLGRSAEFSGSPVFKDMAEQSNAAGQATGLAAGKSENALIFYVAYLVPRFLGLLGVIVIVLVIYAGFLWMTAGGEEEKVTTAKKLLGNAAIGLAIILLAYGITRFIFEIFLKSGSYNR